MNAPREVTENREGKSAISRGFSRVLKYSGEKILDTLVYGTALSIISTYAFDMSPVKAIGLLELRNPQKIVSITARKGDTLSEYGERIRLICPLLRGSNLTKLTEGVETGDVSSAVYRLNLEKAANGLKEGDKVRIPIYCNRQTLHDIPQGVTSG